VTTSVPPSEVTARPVSPVFSGISRATLFEARSKQSTFSPVAAVM